MDNNFKVNKRQFFKSAIGLGGLAAAAGTGLLGSLASVKEAHSQILESGIDPNSVLAKIKKEGKFFIYS